MEQKSKIVTGGYGQEGSQWVNISKTAESTKKKTFQIGCNYFSFHGTLKFHKCTTYIINEPCTRSIQCDYLVCGTHHLSCNLHKMYKYIGCVLSGDVMSHSTLNQSVSALSSFLNVKS